MVANGQDSVINVMFSLALQIATPALSQKGQLVQVRAALLDWNAPVLSSSFAGVDVVLASDVMYDATAAKPLAAIAPQLFSDSAQHPRMLLADPEERTRHHRYGQVLKHCIGQSWL